jgi:hypothetical protein
MFFSRSSARMRQRPASCRQECNWLLVLLILVCSSATSSSKPCIWQTYWLTIDWTGLLLANGWYSLDLILKAIKELAHKYTISSYFVSRSQIHRTRVCDTVTFILYRRALFVVCLSLPQLKATVKDTYFSFRKKTNLYNIYQGAAVLKWA